MTTASSLPPQCSPAVEAHLLGTIDFQRCLQVQQRLIDEVGMRDDGQIVLLLCEHPPVITVGRGGSPGDVASENRLVRAGQIQVHWVNRGGGCMVHCPGQLAVYMIAPLKWHSLTVGEYLRRLQAALLATLADVNITAHTLPGRHGVWGRSGQLAALGIAVRHWVAYYGAYVNVCPPMGLFRLVQADPWHESNMSSLAAERGGRVKMTAVRAALVSRLAEAFHCDRCHLHTGHPLLREADAVRTGS